MGLWDRQVEDIGFSSVLDRLDDGEVQVGVENLAQPRGQHNSRQGRHPLQRLARDLLRGWSRGTRSPLRELRTTVMGAGRDELVELPTGDQGQRLAVPLP